MFIRRKTKGRIEDGISVLKVVCQKKSLLFGYIFFMILMAGINMLTVIVSAKTLEALTLLDYKMMVNYGIASLILYLILFIFSTMSDLLYIKLELYAKQLIQSKVCQRITKITDEVYSTASSGALTMRINQAPQEVFNNLVDVSTTLVTAIEVAMTLVFICYLNWIMALMVLLLLVFVIGGSVFVDSIDTKYYRKLNEANDKLNGKVDEIISGYKDIKCLNLESEINKEVDKYVADSAKAQKYYDIIWLIVQDAVSLFTMLYSLLIVFVGIVLFENTFITAFTLIYIISNKDNIKILGYQLSDFIRYYSRYKSSVRRLNQMFREDLMPTEKFGEKHLDNVRGEIEFKKVCFEYKHYDLNKALKDDMKVLEKKHKKKKDKEKQEETTNEEPKVILKNFNLKINSGESVAFVGKSGCGKSTLVSMLSKSVSPTSGAIYLDGVPYEELDADTIRNNVTIINQFPHIYYMSLRDNIKIVKPQATDEEITQACEKAYLTDFIKDLPFGLDTILGENGVKLSGGQKQRVAIARAFLRNTPILVFDESTSSLDNISQKYVQENIDKIENRTVIIVAHRLSTIINCDKIVFINKGKVEAVGKFDELMENCKNFAKLYRIKGKNEK